MKVDKPRVYVIRVEGHLTDRWSDWFEGLSIHNEPNGETTLSGPFTDQAALFGVLTKIHALNVTLISVNIIRCGGQPDETENIAHLDPGKLGCEVLLRKALMSDDQDHTVRPFVCKLLARNTFDPEVSQSGGPSHNQ